MSSGVRDPLNLGFPCLLSYLSVCCNGWTEYHEILTPGVESPAEPKYDVRIDVQDASHHLRFWSYFTFSVEGRECGYEQLGKTSQ